MDPRIDHRFGHWAFDGGRQLQSPADRLACVGKCRGMSDIDVAAYGKVGCWIIEGSDGAVDCKARCQRPKLEIVEPHIFITD